MRKGLLFIQWIFLVCLNAPAYAQDDSEMNLDKLIILEGGFSFSSPRGNLARSIDNYLYGFDLGFYFQLKADHPYVIGLSSFYHHLGRNQIMFSEVIDGQDFDLRETTNSHMLGLMATMKYFPDFRILGMLPYAEFLLGPKMMFTYTSLIDDYGGNDINEIEFDNYHVSFSYGFGGGIYISLKNKLFIKGGIRYIPGNSSTLYYYNSKDDPGNSAYAIDSFRKIDSATNLLNYSLGLSYFF